MNFSTQGNNNNRSKNKGFTVHVGDTYIGYLVIGEKNVPEDTIVALQDPANMKTILSSAELRAFKEPELVDTSSVMDILAKKSESPAEEAPAEPAPQA